MECSGILQVKNISHPGQGSPVAGVLYAARFDAYDKAAGKKELDHWI